MHLQISVHIWSPPLLLKKHEWEHTTHCIARHFYHPTMGLADHSTAPHKNVLVLSPARVCLTVFPADELLVSNSLFQMMLHLTVSERASCSLCLIAFAAWSPRGGDPGYEPLDFDIAKLPSRESNQFSMWAVGFCVYILPGGVHCRDPSGGWKNKDLRKSLILSIFSYV